MNAYVYVLCDPRKPGNWIYDDHLFDYKPFYVGKTNDLKRRFNEHMKASRDNPGSRMSNVITNIRFAEHALPRLEVVAACATDEAALVEEQAWIKKIGRKDKDEGCLLNRTDGGDGLSLRDFTEAHKANIAEGLRAYHREQKSFCLDEHKERIAKWRQGTLAWWSSRENREAATKKALRTRRLNGTNELIARKRVATMRKRKAQKWLNS